MPFVYPALIREAYDADTVRADIWQGLRTIRENEALRLAGLDAWEITGAERERGLAARDALRGLILGKWVIVRTFDDKPDKYGRLLAVVWLGQLNVNRWLVEHGHAIPSGPTTYENPSR